MGGAVRPTMSDPDVVVLRQGVHGKPVDAYAQVLRNRLPDQTIEQARTPSEEKQLVQSAPVVTGLAMDRDLLARAENLQLFACLYAGTGHLPIDAFEERGVAVTNASGVHAPNISEYVIGSMLTFAQGLHRGWQQQQRREWRSFETSELEDSTVTVVGLGAIGQAVIDRLGSFGVETIGVRYSPEKGGPADEILGFDELHDALSRTDYLVIACPLTDETEGFIDEAAFHTLPSGAVLVNIARGPVVDTDALVGTLQRGDLAGAALDVTDPEPLPEDHPLWTFSNVLVTPHNAGATPRYYERVADILEENVARLADDRELRNREV